MNIPKGFSLKDWQKAKKIGPQEGPQTQFAMCQADLCIFGGAAYGGKTVAEILEPLRAVHNPNFTGVIFRKQSTEIDKPGGLWDTAESFYPLTGAVGRAHDHMWVWPSGAKMKFDHLSDSRTYKTHQGTAYVYLAFDELTHFNEREFWYLWTRNRPATGYVGKCWCRATCNPEADSWVRDLIDWWIGEDGYPIMERSGILRYFTRYNDKIIWVDKDWRDDKGNPPKSLTFIPSFLYDNKIGIAADPTYETNLKSQDEVTREQLLNGNWNISHRGDMFDPANIIVANEDDVPKDMKLWRYWDMAATEVRKEGDDPDWTAGALGGVDSNGNLWILDMKHFRKTPGESEKEFKQTAALDGKSVSIAWEEEKGSSGKYVSSLMSKLLKDYDTHPDPVSGDKITRAKAWCTLSEQGQVFIVRGDWNKKFLAEVGSFPLKKKDQVDAVSGLYKMIGEVKKVFAQYRSQPRGINMAHFRNYRKDLGEFDLYTRHDLTVYIVVNRVKDTGIYVSFYVWSRKRKLLRCYNELIVNYPVLENVAIAIRRLAIVPFKSTSPDRVVVTRTLANDDMLKGGYDGRRVFAKYGIRLKKAVGYDVAGSILTVNQMLAQDQIVVHTDCVTTDREYKKWKINQQDKPEDIGYYPMCQNLLEIVNYLRGQKEFSVKPRVKPYTKGKQKIRETVRNGNVTMNPNEVHLSEKEHEWLLR